MSDRLPLEGLRVLIVEDEFFIAVDLKQILKQNGADPVKMSGSIEDAMLQIKADGFEFALLDINIRGDMTFVVADMFRRKEVPFAFVSGFDRTSIPARFAKFPNWGKPYNEREIIDGIKSLWNPLMKA